LILSHLSKNNNKPELVEQLFAPHAGDVQVVIASRYVASPVFTVEGNAVTAVSKTKVRVKKVKDERQLTLF
jgi:hypothetical protein